MLEHEEVSIGRETSNALCIPDRSVSRRHCLIRNMNLKTELKK